MSQLSQLFPPCPKFTDKDIPDQSGRVFIVTGGASGVGFEVSRILYEKNATVYIATRTASKIEAAIGRIKEQYQTSHGKLEALILDLEDLATIKPAVENFMSKEQRLDVLFNNAGVMGTNPDERSVQVKKSIFICRLLEPILLNTAAHQNSSAGSIRVVWVSSMLDIGTPKGGVVWDLETDELTIHPDMMSNYMQSKAGITFLGHEYAKRFGKKGIISTVKFHLIS
ncbi:uncharacterized protein F4822DRAFT_413846 [Hypoxylon trugodes]|uniref:uncharacterized protein n=1 Tax=Hypoxylon trugodes TaxID=326681 RepID=UPI00218EA1BD|nr:uncharacterized protein F4822DRAFT_413846 [Hypoxylon trugodes]KAI1385666.1 hypothetical protein F4822DRAFT_413846 [Hypoxylon trugodes]